MRLDRKWPAWHPEQELKAEQLLGLEDYLVARTALFIDDNAHGVDLFNWRQNVTLDVANDGVRVGVSRLQGITPAGEPVCLTSSEVLSAVVPLVVESGSVGAPPTISHNHVLDLWIIVNPAAVKTADVFATDEDVLPVKLALHVELVLKNETEAINPAGQHHHLYLGRYRWIVAGGGGRLAHDMVHPPFVRRFGALEPRDEAWSQWVSPLRTRVEALVNQIVQAPVPSTVVAVLLSSELVRLAFEWVALPIPMLYRRLKFISWLTARQGADRELLDLPAALSVFPGGADVTGQNLPGFLADLLPDVIVAGPVDPPTLPIALGVLFQALSTDSVDYHAPVLAFERWLKELQRVKAAGRVPAVDKLLHDPIDVEFQQIQTTGGLTPWITTAMLLTGAVVETSTGIPLPQSVLERQGLRAGNISLEAARALGDLYRSEAASKRAGPLAFYWFARVAAEVPQIAALADADVAAYLAQLEGRAGADAKGRRITPQMTRVPRTPGRSNRVLTYLTAVQQYANSAPAESVSWTRAGKLPIDRSSRRTEPITATAVKVVLIGPTGSGKTTLVRQLVVFASNPSTTRTGRFQLAMTSSENGISTYDGAIGLPSADVPLKVIDVAGALLDATEPPAGRWDSSGRPLYAALKDSQLVIITLDPFTIASPYGSDVVERVGRLARAFLPGSAARIAIAYTKADEYGVVNPGALRLVDHRQSLQLRQALAGSADAWDKFVRASGGADAQSRHVGGAVLTKPGSVIASTEWSPTREWLLERTRSLWEAIGATREGAPLLNAYFVCAEPLDSRFARVEDRGFLQILADFLGQIEGRV